MRNTDSSHTNAVLAQFDDTETKERLTFQSTLASCSQILSPHQAGTTIPCQNRLCPPSRGLRILSPIYFPHSAPLCRIHGVRRLQRDVVYFGRPIAPSYYEPKCGGGGEFAGSQPMSTAVHRSPNKLCRSDSIFNLCMEYRLSSSILYCICRETRVH
jgi:hypothetical protein